MIELSMWETSDEERDMARLSRLFQFLENHPGLEPVSLTLTTLSREKIMVTLPAVTRTEALEAALKLWNLGITA